MAQLLSLQCSSEVQADPRKEAEFASQAVERCLGALQPVAAAPAPTLTCRKDDSSENANEERLLETGRSCSIVFIVVLAAAEYRSGSRR